MPPATPGDAQSGQVVMVEIVSSPARTTQADRPRRRDPRQLSPTPAWKSRSRCASTICRYEFPPDVEAQAAKLPNKVLKKDMAGREDLRDLPLVTIDGETARDFDDAVYCEPLGRSGFRLLVAIADVSHYVQPRRRARHAKASTAATRCTSRAASSRCCRRRLSNGLCSLNPEVDRLSMVCDMEISAPAASRNTTSTRR